MPVTPLGIATPNSGDDWDLVIDLAAMAVTVDNAITSEIGSIPPPVPVRGNSTLRDATFGVPGNNTQRAALANQRATWFNTDSGWTESYYADSAIAGLTVPGLVAGTTSGWYPVGNGPEISLIASAQQSLSSGVAYTQWAAPGTGQSWRRGTQLSLSAGVVTTTMPGRYEASCLMVSQTGSGAIALGMLRNNLATAGNLAAQAVFTLSGTFYIPEWIRTPSFALAANDNLRIQCISAGTVIFNIGAGGSAPQCGGFYVRYVGPNLVTQ